MNAQVSEKVYGEETRLEPFVAYSLLGGAIEALQRAFDAGGCGMDLIALEYRIRDLHNELDTLALVMPDGTAEVETTTRARFKP